MVPEVCRSSSNNAQFTTQQTTGSGEAPQFGPQSYVMTPENVAESISNLIRIWGILAIIFGVIDIVGTLFLQELQNITGQTISAGQIYLEGTALFVSGLTALTSSLLLKKRKLFWISFICCLVAAFSSYFGMGGFIGIMTTMIGFYMSFAVMRCRRAFQS